MEAKFEKFYERHKAHDLVNEGINPKEVARRLGRSYRFVNRWFRRGSSGRGYFDQKRPGGPRRVQDDLSKVEKRLLKRKKKGSSKAVATELYSKYGIKVSDRTVRRDARRLGLKYRIRRIKPRLTPRDKVKRVKFAKKRRSYGFWKKVWWSDEKAFTLHNDPRGQWVEVADEVEPREKDLVESTVRVWGAISSEGQTKLYRIKPFWTAAEYKDFLKNKAIPNIQSISGNDFVFEQDGDGAHRGNVVKKYFIEEGVLILDDLPAHSPDIPPIENMWSELFRRMKNRTVKTLDGLWIALKEEWEKLGLEKFQRYIDSVPGRLNEIIALQGNITKH